MAATASTNAAGAFDLPVGTERVVRLLGRSLERGALHHAWLFAGPDGAGTEPVARWLAALLVCGQRRAGPDGVAPCGVCSSCARARELEHPDLELVEPPEGKKIIPIERIRALISKLHYRPLSAPRRLIVVPAAERMNEAAANALLKTLEEPADYNVFVLTSARPHALLDTIRSRCQQVRFVPPGHAAAHAALRARGVADDDAIACAVASGGTPALAAALNDADFPSRAAAVLDVWLAPGAAAGLSTAEVVKMASDLAKRHRDDDDPLVGDVGVLLRSLRFGLRDAWLLAAGADAAQLCFPGRRDQWGALAVVGPARLGALVDAVRGADVVFRRPLNLTLNLEALLLRLHAGMSAVRS